MKTIYKSFLVSRSGTFVAALFVFFTVAGSNAQNVNTGAQDGKVFFKIRKDVSIDIPHQFGKINLTDAWFISQEVRESFHITGIRKPFFAAKSPILDRIYEIQFDDILKVNELIRILSGLDIIEYAEQVPLDRTTYVPNDPSYALQQWPLPLIRAPQAWDLIKGSKSVIVAIVDCAISLSHPDLTAAIWVNPGEIPNNGIDDDGNGYIDDKNGYDVADRDNNPNPPNTTFDHGTHVAGIAGAVTDNGVGIASIGFGITLMPVKATGNASAATSIIAGYEGITYAVVAGARVINCSWGSGTFSQTAQYVIDYAASKGSIVVAAAGNSGTETLFYPAAYNHVISVVSTTNTDARSSFSDFGTWVDISAPGSNIYSTVPNTGYAVMSGTSMASPLVAGLCGLMISANPALTATQVEACLKSSAVNIDAQNPSYIGKMGAGRINAEAAVICAASTAGMAPLAAFYSDERTSCTGLINFKDSSLNNPAVWLWNFGDGATSALANPSHTYASSGTYTVRLRVSNTIGADSTLKIDYITIAKPAGPLVIPATRCGNGSLTVSATSSGGILNWYNNPTGGTSIFSGTSFITPILSSTTTYYVEETATQPVQKAGPPDNTLGTGAYFSSTQDRRVFFDVYVPAVLQSVKVYANSAGNRTIEVRRSNGTLIGSVTANVPVGQSKVTLNMNLPLGTGFYIKLSGMLDMYRNDAGAVYPYTLPGILSITGTDASTASYYYFFYDWEVRKSTCISERVPVQATITFSTPTITQNGYVLTSSPGNSYQWYLNGSSISGATNQVYTAIQDGSYTVEVTGNGCTVMSNPVTVTGVGIVSVNEDELSMYPDPVTNQFTISGIRHSSGFTLDLYNMLGEKVYTLEARIANSEQQVVDVSGFSRGIYLLVFRTESKMYRLKLVKE